MTSMRSRCLDALLAAVIAAMCVLVLVFFLTGPAYFLGVLSGVAFNVLGISAAAGLARLYFRRGGFALSAACGVGVAVIGYLVVLGIVVARI